jgi:hypothetical protein
MGVVDHVTNQHANQVTVNLELVKETAKFRCGILQA